MRTHFVLLCLLCTSAACYAQSGYKSLDSAHPITFKGTSIQYEGDEIELGPHAFFVDGQLTDEAASKYVYVYNSLRSAIKDLSPGTENDPMTLYFAPFVYWVDDPDDPEIRIPEEGDPVPFGLKINCPWLRFYGLNPDARNVVLACNRGQTIGAKGNFTMFKLWGDGISSENITFGNYCNVDLEFPLMPSLNREKRASAIVQAQLIICNGDKIVARNTRFISRLNLCPFVGGKRVLFDHCHFESTDDALCGTGIYLHSTFTFFSSKPFYNTVGTGAIFLNCGITSYTHGAQYFTKANGQMAIVDCRFSTTPQTTLGWRDHPPYEMRNYQFNVLQNGKPAFIDQKHSYATVPMDEASVLNAYRFKYHDKVVYNIYNLLKGDDDWDPLGQKEMVIAMAENASISYDNMPVQLLVSGQQKEIETGRDSLLLKASLYRFGNFKAQQEMVKWTIADEDTAYLTLNPSKNGAQCIVLPTNYTDESKRIIVKAHTASGLQAAYSVVINPSILAPPAFEKWPRLMLKDGAIGLEYQLKTKFDDQSVIKWYRCKDKSGANAIPVAVSRFDQPLKKYELNAGDIGYFIMAEIRPKHQRSDPGKAVTSIMKKTVKEKNVIGDEKNLDVNFIQMSAANQPESIPGFWILNHFDAEDHGRDNVYDPEEDAWYYGKGRDGAVLDSGFIQTGRNACLLYTPLPSQKGDIDFELKVAPFKTAGQGFSVAHMYMDVVVKYDAKSGTGYGLRLIRTTKYGNAIDCFFVHYEKGKATPISKAVSTSAFRTPCTINVSTSDDVLSAKLSTIASYSTNGYPDEVLSEVNMSVSIAENGFNGCGVLYNGGAQTLFKALSVKWR